MAWQKTGFGRFSVVAGILYAGRVLHIHASGWKGLQIQAAFLVFGVNILVLDAHEIREVGGINLAV